VQKKKDECKKKRPLMSLRHKPIKRYKSQLDKKKLTQLNSRESVRKYKVPHKLDEAK